MVCVLRFTFISFAFIRHLHHILTFALFYNIFSRIIKLQTLTQKNINKTKSSNVTFDDNYCCFSVSNQHIEAAARQNLVLLQFVYLQETVELCDF